MLWLIVVVGKVVVEDGGGVSFLGVLPFSLRVGVPEYVLVLSTALWCLVLARYIFAFTVCY